MTHHITPMRIRAPRPNGNSVGRGGMLAVLVGGLVAVPAALAQPTAPEVPAPAERPMAFLQEQAAFWLKQNKPELALVSIERLLAVKPHDTDTLAFAIETAAAAGQPQAAQRHLSTLRQVAPTDPRISRAEDMARLLTEHEADLVAARQAAANGATAEALKRYRQITKGGHVAPAIASEYYTVLANSSEAGYREAVQELGRRVQREPNDAHLALTHARLLTLREDTRTDGVDRMAGLSGQPGLREIVRPAWREALLWLGDEAETVARIDQYLAINPSDPEIEAKRKSSDQQLDPGIAARILAWNEVDARRYDEAERQFRVALSVDPNDAEALVGMAVLRKIQNRLPEARQLMGQAVAAAPDRQEEFARSVGDLSGRAPAGSHAAVDNGPSTRARKALLDGDIGRAEALAQRASQQRGREAQEAVVVLGLIALRQERWSIAEHRFREALSERPRHTEAQQGLFEALQRQGRFTEADALRQQTGLTPWPSWEAVRSQALREEAMQLPPPQAIAMLQTARQRVPTDPWVRSDLVRLLRQSGQESEADAIEAETVAIGTPDALFAAASVAAANNRPADAMRYLERIPARQRSADAEALRGRLPVLARVEQLEKAAQRGESRDALLALAGERDPSGMIGSSIVRALGRLGDQPRTVEAARRALAANGGTDNTGAAAAIASALAEAGAMTEAGALADRLLAKPDLQRAQRNSLTLIGQGGAMAEAAAHGKAGQPALGMQRLAPYLAAHPDDTALTLADGWLRLADRRPVEATRIAAAVLERDGSNAEARRLAIAAAETRRDIVTARRLVREGLERTPGDPALLATDARLRANTGDPEGARRSYDTAVSRLSARPRLSEQERELLAQMMRERTQLRNDRQAEFDPSVMAGVNFRNRNGEAGRARLTELEAPVEAGFAAPGGHGRITLSATSVTLDAGRARLDNASTPYGSVVPSRAGGAVRGGAVDAAGVGLGLAYSLGPVRIDVGTTPIGFPLTTFTGGIEAAPAIAENVRLRLGLERRAVTDSVLSYAGARDPGTGEIWGGVTRNALRLQLEAAPGRWNLYAGGSYAVLDGERVVENKRYELGAGAAYSVIRDEKDDVSVGVDLRRIGYDRNLRYHTLGHGGYFSPQGWNLATLQTQWTRHLEDVSFRLGAALGWQSFRESAEQVFPGDAALQTALTSAGDTGLYPSQRSNGLIGGVNGNVEYAASRGLRLGVSGRVDHSGDYTQAAAMLYLRYTFLPPLPAGL